MLSKLSIRIKILMIVIGGVVGLVASQAYNYSVTINNKVMLEDVRDIYFPVLERLDTALVRMDKIKESYSMAVISGDEDILEDVANLNKKFKQVLTEIAGIDQKNEALVDSILQDFNQYIKIATPLSMKLIDETIEIEAAKPLIQEMNRGHETVNNTLSDFRNQSYQHFNGAINKANKASSDAIYTGVTIGILITLLLSVVGWLISQSIVRNITAVNQSLNEMANGNGDLSTRLKSETNDEIGTLVENFNRFVGKLHGVIAEVSGSTERVAEAAIKMKRVSKDSVNGMDEQQREISQVISAMADMDNSVESVSNSASQAVSAANTTSSEANDGKQVVEENMKAIDCLAKDIECAAEAIEKLEADSESIGKVLSVISDIAEQTNLLALNAAIEAARAGEQGRGFAVVADEVRTLATRTHEATEEINTMINRLQAGTKNAMEAMTQSRDQANTSVTQAGRVGESLERITQGITEINNINTQIASAAEEQSSVASEINTNIVNLGQVVSQVAGGARVANDNSEELSTLAGQLKTQVSVFKI